MKYTAPRKNEILICLGALAFWLIITAAFVGFRPEHPVMALLIAALFFAGGASRRLVMALLPFAIFGISYDWMNMVPNYTVNDVDIAGIYESEKSLFGITTAAGILTPNEFFAQHTNGVLDFLCGIFYLCWVPVPIMFGIYLYYARKEKSYLHFALVFLFVNLLGFAGYYIHPAAPPWFVAEHGTEFILGTGGSVAGLGAFDRMIGVGIFDAIYARNANVFAAVPSLHSAYTLVAFIYSVRSKAPMGWKITLAVITLGIWFTAVYTSHHYIIDVLLGIACALLGFVLFEYGLMRIRPFARFISSYVKYITPQK